MSICLFHSLFIILYLSSFIPLASLSCERIVVSEILELVYTHESFLFGFFDDHVGDVTEQDVTAVDDRSPDPEQPAEDAVLELLVKEHVEREPGAETPHRQAEEEETLVFGFGLLDGLEGHERLDEPAVFVEVGEEPEVDPEEAQEDVDRELHHVQTQDHLDDLVDRYLDSPGDVLGQAVRELEEEQLEHYQKQLEGDLHVVFGVHLAHRPAHEGLLLVVEGLHVAHGAHVFLELGRDPRDFRLLLDFVGFHFELGPLYAFLDKRELLNFFVEVGVQVFGLVLDPAAVDGFGDCFLEDPDSTKEVQQTAGVLGVVGLH